MKILIYDIPCNKNMLLVFVRIPSTNLMVGKPKDSNVSSSDFLKNEENSIEN